MTATDELRRLLDERGADYRVSATGYSIDIGPYTTAYANRSDTTLDVSLRQVTPAQAIAATLGAGTCRIERRHMDWRCTGCGEVVGTDDPTSELFIDGNAVELWHYCPNCGRRIEVDA